MLLLGFGTPAHAADPSCFIGVDNASVLVDASLGSVDRAAMPSSVTKTAAFQARCGVSALLPGGYRWVLTAKASRITMLAGTTSQSVLNALVKTVSFSTTTLEVNNALLGDPASYQTSASVTGKLSGLSSQLSAGTYRLTQNIDVQRQSCTWLLLLLVCANDGGRQTFVANYTLTVTEQVVAPPVVTPPGGGQGQGPSTPTPAPTPGKGIKPNPWTVRGAVRKYRCEI